jgi:hypothetical protein
LLEISTIGYACDATQLIQPYAIRLGYIAASAQSVFGFCKHFLAPGKRINGCAIAFGTPLLRSNGKFNQKEWVVPSQSAKSLQSA